MSVVYGFTAESRRFVVSDSQVTDQSGVISGLTKVFEFPSVIVGVVGSAGSGATFAGFRPPSSRGGRTSSDRWISQRFLPAVRGFCEQTTIALESLDLLLATGSGFWHVSGGEGWPVLGAHWAIGSGADLALGALGVLADEVVADEDAARVAYEVFEIVCSRHALCGGFAQIRELEY